MLERHILRSECGRGFGTSGVQINGEWYCFEAMTCVEHDEIDCDIIRNIYIIYN
jgi:hypothetical protein